ncbi:hypothetical protein ES703_10476 [subsurface metagenome]
MLFGKLTKCGTRLALALILGLALIGSLPTPAQAQATVDLELGGEGATSWNIGNIKPGDSGAKTVELHNAGSRHGVVTIWISDIEEVDYGGDGAVLDDYVLLNLSGKRLSTDITLPAAIHQLPQSASDANQMKIDWLLAGETLTLVWEWEFPETGEPQNDAQGDSFSFTINYLLEQLPSGGGGTPNYQQLKIDILGKVTWARVSSSGEFLDSFVATDPDNKHSLELERGTKVTCPNGKVPRRIEMRVCEEPPLPPSGMEMIGPAYDLTGCISDSVPCSLIFDKPAALTLGFDLDWLPENTSSIVITSYEPEYGWTELEPAYSSVAQAGNEVTVLISHTSIFAIFARIAPSPPSAKFELSELAIDPAQTEVGEPVTISTIVQNTGDLAGSYEVTLKINDVVEATSEVTLDGGASESVTFTVDREEAGSYSVSIDGLSGSFTVTAPEEAEDASTDGAALEDGTSVNWPVLGGVIAAVVIIGLLIFFVVRRRAA